MEAYHHFRMLLYQPPSLFPAEHRLLSLFRQIGHNVGSLVEEIRADAGEAAHDHDPIKFAITPVVGAARVILKLPTNILLGILDKPVEPYTGNETSKTIQETGKELFTFHPLRATVHALNIVDSFTLDCLRTVAGLRGQIHAKAEHAMSGETDYSMAA